MSQKLRTTYFGGSLVLGYTDHNIIGSNFMSQKLRTTYFGGSLVLGCRKMKQDNMQSMISYARAKLHQMLNK